MQNLTPSNNVLSQKEITLPHNVTIKRHDEGEDIIQEQDQVGSKTTFNDLMNTLKLLEEDDKFPTARNENKPLDASGIYSSMYFVCKSGSCWA